MIEEAWPAAKGSLTHLEQPMPFAERARRHRATSAIWGRRPRTGLRDGVRQTLDEFARLQKDGRLDARELA